MQGRMITTPWKAILRTRPIAFWFMRYQIYSCDVSFWRTLVWSWDLIEIIGIGNIPFGVNSYVKNFIIEGNWQFSNAVYAPVQILFQDMQDSDYLPMWMNMARRISYSGFQVQLTYSHSHLHGIWSKLHNLLSNGIAWYGILEAFPRWVAVSRKQFMTDLKQGSLALVWRSCALCPTWIAI